MLTPYERPRGRGSNLVFKSGPLFISSKGLGWKSWKKRWFILTRTSLVFFKDDPNIHTAKGNDPSVTLGGIDLNNSGSVVVRADKKLLTVLFPDGRAFTLKAETTEDMEEWKVALERALAAAPNAALVMGHDGIFRNDSIDAYESSVDLGKERRSVKSLVVGRPILLALEDIDGSPSFLEKALCFIEQYGVKVEGILRQAADVDDVERRVCDYEQDNTYVFKGRNQFSPDEDAHVIGDCIKHVLRELPSSPVPTPCCTALIEAYRIEGKEARIASMRLVVADTFPEPNRRLLQRVLRMMRAVAAHTAENRMTASAVSACMAPLLLRPLLAGECGLEDDSDISGDSTAQLLAATAAANNAQAIVTTLLEEYDQIFEDNEAERPPSPVMYPNMDGSESGDLSEEEELKMHDEKDFHNTQIGPLNDPDEDPDRVLSGTLSESSNGGSDGFDYKVFEGGESDYESPRISSSSTSKPKVSTKSWARSVRLRTSDSGEELDIANFHTNDTPPGKVVWQDAGSDPSAPSGGLSGANWGHGIDISKVKGRASASGKKHGTVWGNSSDVTENTDAQTADDTGEEELAIRRLEATRNELRNKIAKEAKGNAILQASLERRKQALHDRRLALEQDVARLQEQLQLERDLRLSLEVGLSTSAAHTSSPQKKDPKMQAELEEIAYVEADVARLKQRIAELHIQLNQQRQQQGYSLAENTECLQRVKGLQSQQKILQQELDLTLALCHRERQRNDELEGRAGQEDPSTLEHVVAQQRSALAEAKEALKAERVRGHDLRGRPLFREAIGGDWQTLQPPPGPSTAGRQFAWRTQADCFSPMELIKEAPSDSTKNVNRLNGLGNYFSGPKSDISAQGATPRSSQRQLGQSNALLELTTRLEFFKERRSQLLEQLQTLDPTLAPSLS
ncbi:hypothetical protein O6H91_12G018100 [Diphasiastrum complanatum]|uniref:Uncharacterized protein n=1 Tax=Diphasiastrum complanatum TaxID=34168 RepID=A0ACC2BZC7_DIPCM|nr:hypothetical protein O6H91_12G018100 [Diphasiastrum complanatum]